MKIKAVLSQGSFWQVNKHLTQHLGSIESSLLLSDLIDKHSYTDNKIELEGRLWFFSTAKQIEEATTLTYRIQKKCIKNLEAHGLIESRLMGVPAKLHFTICEESIWNMLQASIDKNAILEDINCLNDKSTIDKNAKLHLTKTQNISNNTVSNNTDNNTESDLFKKDLILPWDSKEFISKWLMWKSYKKKEKAFHFKSLVSEQAALKKLAEISSGNEENAKSIIVQSIENGWSGLFKLKNNNGEYKKDLFSQEAVKERFENW